MRRSLLRLSLAGVVSLALASAAAAAPPYDPPPPGANDFSCRPSVAHPNPLVLVHGLGATMYENWQYMSPLLAARGYCVFALTYGTDDRLPYFGGVIPIEQSAPQLGDFVDRVLAQTGASKVDLVGHSEGTFMPQYWLKLLGGAAKVDKYVALTPLYDGTDFHGLVTLSESDTSGFSQTFVASMGQFCGSCPEFLHGSAMVKKLQEGGAAAPGVTYTTIMTRYDELVTPYTSGELHSPSATNIVLQDVCPNDVSEHGEEAFDPVVAQIVFNTLDPPGAKPVACDGLPPLAPPPST
jgi:triacylglycerol esterase/lipase EstA (alpha/beta hydrolase family)